ncbi:N-acyl homoserine lactonase family protein [Archangium minus]|uniref:N-acyl homoserine lactonase family protein n=1 Tax=Archangium minus TaxID=83450 RepID=A0ABY9WYL6_9BACT|nr:N-acyl homoserine lactonase family protein [Archangium minus]
MSDVRRLYILRCGYEILPKSVSVHGADPTVILCEPVCAYLLDTAHGWVLFDTGADPARLKDPVLRQRFFSGPGWLAPPIVLPEHELLPQLARLGVGADDISAVILSHVHYDHTGHLKYFRNARIYIQRREYDYAMGPHGNPAVFDDDYRLADREWRLVDGDWELMPGLRGVLTLGHMPGHQSVVVELPASGTKILVADAGDLHENFEQERAPGECSDPALGIASIRKLKAIRDATGGEFVFMHDPDDVHSRRLAPDFYE